MIAEFETMRHPDGSHKDGTIAEFTFRSLSLGAPDPRKEDEEPTDFPDVPSAVDTSGLDLGTPIDGTDFVTGGSLFTTLLPVLLGDADNTHTINRGASDDARFVSAGRGNDMVTGSDAFDGLFGDDGADSLFGGGAGDTLFGGNGSDWIEGGEGGDLLIGDNALGLPAPFAALPEDVATSADSGGGATTDAAAVAGFLARFDAVTSPADGNKAKPITVVDGTITTPFLTSAETLPNPERDVLTVDNGVTLGIDADTGALALFPDMTGGIRVEGLGGEDLLMTANRLADLNADGKVKFGSKLLDFYGANLGIADSSFAGEFEAFRYDSADPAFVNDNALLPRPYTPDRSAADTGVTYTFSSDVTGTFEVAGFGQGDEIRSTQQGVIRDTGTGSLIEFPNFEVGVVGQAVIQSVDRGEYVYTVPGNQAPVFFPLVTAVYRSENQADLLYTPQAFDPEGDPFTIVISGGVDADLFELSANGALRYKSAPDYETPLDANRDNEYLVELTASDRGSDAVMRLSVYPLDVNEFAPVFVSEGTGTALENQRSTSYRALAGDEDGSASVGYGIGGGADAALFDLLGDGTLRFTDPQDFEAPGDADADGTYEVIIEATDGFLVTEQAVEIVLLDLDETV